MQCKCLSEKVKTVQEKNPDFKNMEIETGMMDVKNAFIPTFLIHVKYETITNKRVKKAKGVLYSVFCPFCGIKIIKD